MHIVAHRGAWIKESEKNTEVAFRRAFNFRTFYRVCELECNDKLNSMSDVIWLYG